MINKITTLDLFFEKPYTEKELIDKGFQKIKNDSKKNIYYQLELNGLFLLYLNKKYSKEVIMGRLTVYIKEDRMIKYKDAKEFNLVKGLKTLEQININTCDNLEIYGRGDISKLLMKEDSNWVQPEWINDCLLYKDEHNGLGYYQFDGFYKIAYDDKINLNDIVK